MKVLWFAGGVFLVVLVIDSAVRTFMLPRGEASITTRAVFVGLRGVFNRLARLTRTYEGRDRVMALYAPVGLLVLPLVWLRPRDGRVHRDVPRAWACGASSGRSR